MALFVFLCPSATATATATATAPASIPGDGVIVWSPDGEAELAKIPFFVRGKVRKNTEAYAREQGLALIDSEALYEAKAHFAPWWVGWVFLPMNMCADPH